MTVWVCGRYVATRRDGSVAWELQGIYSTKEIAIKNCKNINEFIGPVRLNELLPNNRMTTWPGCYYPNEVTGAVGASLLKEGIYD